MVRASTPSGMPTPAPTITTSFLLLWHSDAWLSEAVFWLASVLAGQKLDTVRLGVEVGDEVGLEVEDDELTPENFQSISSIAGFVGQRIRLQQEIVK